MGSLLCFRVHGSAEEEPAVGTKDDEDPIRHLESAQPFGNLATRIKAKGKRQKEKGRTDLLTRFVFPFAFYLLP